MLTGHGTAALKAKTLAQPLHNPSCELSVSTLQQLAHAEQAPTAIALACNKMAHVRRTCLHWEQSREADAGKHMHSSLLPSMKMVAMVCPFCGLMTVAPMSRPTLCATSTMSMTLIQLAKNAPERTIQHESGC